MQKTKTDSTDHQHTRTRLRLANQTAYDQATAMGPSDALGIGNEASRRSTDLPDHCLPKQEQGTSRADEQKKRRKRQQKPVVHVQDAPFAMLHSQMSGRKSWTCPGANVSQTTQGD
ncbi:LPS glycosyltransferase IcsA [Anopheles sinensis]|uniref:LPS glycosyltransferase IcsA n=1 Tax=Anopheles sinensis TaxID=74873 RepID=A0A084WS45_ANOSI|nr:LPS glycosyltransferase IcsA [Anopheles sinensis]